MNNLSQYTIENTVTIAEKYKDQHCNESYLIQPNIAPVLYKRHYAQSNAQGEVNMLVMLEGPYAEYYENCRNKPHGEAQNFIELFQKKIQNLHILSIGYPHIEKQMSDYERTFHRIPYYHLGHKHYEAMTQTINAAVNHFIADELPIRNEKLHNCTIAGISISAMCAEQIANTNNKIHSLLAISPAPYMYMLADIQKTIEIEKEYIKNSYLVEENYLNYSHQQTSNFDKILDTQLTRKYNRFTKEYQRESKFPLEKITEVVNTYQKEVLLGNKSNLRKALIATSEVEYETYNPGYILMRNFAPEGVYENTTTVKGNHNWETWWNIMKLLANERSDFFQ